MGRKVIMTGKISKKIDGRAMRGVDSELIILFKQVLAMYGTSGTKFLLGAIIEGKLKPKF